MRLPAQKPVIIFINMFLSVIAGVIIYFLVHEFSHLLTMMICNGTFTEMQLGMTSYVGGYIPQQYISTVAMSSLVLPTLVSVVFLGSKRFYNSIFLVGFTFPNILNGVLGIYAIYFVNNGLRNTYDMALAYDYAEHKWIILALTVLFVLINVIMLTFKFKLFADIEKDG